MLRVANIIEEGRYGGPQSRICSVAERLKEYGVETLIICPLKGSERLYNEAVHRKIEINRISMRRLNRSKKAILQYFLTFPREVHSLWRILRDKDVDIVHCNSARQLKGVIAGRLARKKVIWHLHDTWNPFVIRALFAILAFVADYFIVAGERVHRYYISKTFYRYKPAKIIQAPVDTLFYNPDIAYSDSIISAKKGIKVLTVGNINPAKGYEFFIEAAYRCKINDEICFWIVGMSINTQKNYYKRLQTMAKKLVHSNLLFYGPSDDIRAILKSADIYVCSSIYEASPVSVWEAMAMEKAIITTDVGDVAHFIKSDESGFVVPVGDSRAIAEILKKLIKNQTLREKLGRNAREVACRQLDLNIAVKRHFEAYRECLENRGSWI